jgi:hypothetical protein
LGYSEAGAARPGGASTRLADAYGAADDSLVLIRPDGYVALISDAGDAWAVSGFGANLAGVALTAIG